VLCKFQKKVAARHFLCKKQLIFITLILLVGIGLHVISITDYEGVSVGMPAEEIYELVPEDYFGYTGYIFYLNKWGNPVVVNFDDYSAGYPVEEVRCFSSLWTSRSPKAFKRLKEGMDVFDVTRIVGIPLGTRTSGMRTTYYTDTLGNEWVIYWGSKVENPNDWYATSLRKNREDIWP